MSKLWWNTSSGSRKAIGILTLLFASIIGGARDHAAITNYLNVLKADYEGVNDLSNGAKNYMLDLGLTKGEINNIKGILLGDITI